MKNNLAGLDKNKNTIIVVCGPTASGKTGLALSLCRHFNGELVNADSMQIYKDLPIGTATPSAKETGNIPVHLAGFLLPETAFSVADYLKQARPIIEDINCRGKLAVVCGGTGLYIKNLIEGTIFTKEKTDEVLRQKLEEEWQAKGGEAMLINLAKLDTARAANLHANDKKRVLRALELCYQTGKTALEREAESKPSKAPYNTLCLGINFENREELYQRIDTRVKDMLTLGILQEAEKVYQNQQRYTTAAQAIGFKEFFAYFNGEDTLENCTLALQQATRRYAKRQLTWLRQMAYMQWLIADETLASKAILLSQNFLS